MGAFYQLGLLQFCGKLVKSILLAIVIVKCQIIISLILKSHKIANSRI